MEQIPAKRLLIVAAAVIALAGCKKETSEPSSPSSSGFSNTTVLDAFVVNVAQADYNDLAAKALVLQQAVTAFNTSLSDADLSACKQDWRDTRQAYEQSEGMLFGPVATANIDPRIDTWPVNFTDLESQLSSGNPFTAPYINGLEDALKGFHPIEYLLFGQHGDKSAAQMTAREREYLTALCQNLVDLTAQLKVSWDPTQSGNYSGVFSTAGTGNAVYPTQRAAFEEMVNAMNGICDEVANGKMTEPLVAQDPSLEESPFAKNSINDFKNNITSVQHVYLGLYTTDGTGLDDLVRQYNLQLDNTIKTQITTALNALNSITVPFGEAIITQQVQVHQAIDAINALSATITQQLLPLVQQHT